jgi:glycosyltransferase involved in cell wall biosynthesis
MKIVLTSYTPIGAGGGVPRWNRDFMAGFPKGAVVHYSWSDVIKATGRDAPLPEWEKARTLNAWLRATKKIEKDDIVITDGFWGIGLEDLSHRIVSVAHGNWGHTTADDVAKGIPPEFPQHQAVQVDYRRNHLKRGGRIVAVSDFIAVQCKLQWNFEMPVINNGIDLKKFVPVVGGKSKRNRPVIIHGVTNSNKGFDHIEAVKKLEQADVLLLDEAPAFFNVPKYPALAQADLVIVPSAHEGNSYFVLETLASGVPVVAYDVGLMFRARKENAPIGIIMDRAARSKEHTAREVSRALVALKIVDSDPRGWVSQFSVENFQQEWRDYLRVEMDFHQGSIA